MIPDHIREIINRELSNNPPVLTEGWLTPERGVELAELVLEHKPETIVEIGVFGGRSLICQALALREIGKGKVYGIDPWKVEAALEGENVDNREWWQKNVDLHGIHKGAMETIWRLGLEEWAIVIRAKSQHVPVLFAGGIDLLNIDGNHSEIASCRDVRNYLPMVAPGGIVAFDDADWPTTKAALTLLDAECDLAKDTGHYRIYVKRLNGRATYFDSNGASASS